MHNDSYLESSWTALRGIQAPLQPVDAQSRTLVRGGTVLSMDADVGDLDVGDVLLQGSKIISIGKNLGGEGANVIDAAGMIVMPGFVDSHRHAWEGQLRRIAPDSSSLMDYLHSTHFSFATHYRPSDMYVGNLLTALGAIDAGITTIVDNSHNTRSSAHAHAAIDALEHSGIRAVYAPGAPLAGEWETEHWPAHVEKLQQSRFTSHDSLVSLAMMSQWDRENWAFARRLGLRIITEFLGREMGNLLPKLREEGLLGSDNIFNHNTGLTDDEWEILREAGVQVNVCPRSDAQYGLEEGVHTFQRALDHSVKPAISIDVEASYGGDMFAEMRAAYFVQRAYTQMQRFRGEVTAANPMGVRTVLESATATGAKVAGLEAITGTLTPGKQADLILVRTDALNVYPSNHAIGTIVHAAERSNIDTVIVGGRIRKSAGQVIGVDAKALRTATEASRSYLFQQAGYQPDPFAKASPTFSSKAST